MPALVGSIGRNWVEYKSEWITAAKLPLRRATFWPEHDHCSVIITPRSDLTHWQINAIEDRIHYIKHKLSILYTGFTSSLISIVLFQSVDTQFTHLQYWSQEDAVSKHCYLTCHDPGFLWKLLFNLPIKQIMHGDRSNNISLHKTFPYTI